MEREKLSFLSPLGDPSGARPPNPHSLALWGNLEGQATERQRP